MFSSGCWQLPQVVDGIQLNVGDEVSFVFGVNAKTGDRLARRLRRMKEAPPGVASAHHHHHAEFVAEHNPNAMKFVGNRTKVGHADSVQLNLVGMNPYSDPIVMDLKAKVP